MEKKLFQILMGNITDVPMGSIFDVLMAYLIFVNFFTGAKFLENKITPKKRVNYDKIHSKLPIFALLRQNTQ